MQRCIEEPIILRLTENDLVASLPTADLTLLYWRKCKYNNNDEENIQPIEPPFSNHSTLQLLKRRDLNEQLSPFKGSFDSTSRLALVELDFWHREEWVTFSAARLTEWGWRMVLHWASPEGPSHLRPKNPQRRQRDPFWPMSPSH